MGRVELSVILGAAEGYGPVRKTVRHLRGQTAAASIELVLVVPSRAKLVMPESEMRGLGGWTVVECRPMDSVGQANAAGVRAAAAPIVVMAEDHCFPERDWAARLIEAHKGPWAAVGPVVKIANPGTSVSWADYFIGYGPFMWPCESRESEFLPGHNCSYKRDVLLTYDSDLERMLDTETVLHWDMRSKGHRLYLDSTVRVLHTNFSRWAPWLSVHYLGGRIFAGARTTQQTAVQRWAYFAGSPLIPLVRLARLSRAAISREMGWAWLRCLPALVVGLSADGAGQAAGYLMGPGNARSRMAQYEFCRARHVTPQDQREVFGFTERLPEPELAARRK